MRNTNWQTERWNTNWRKFWKEQNIFYDSKTITSSKQFVSACSTEIFNTIKKYQIKPYYITTTKKETTDIFLQHCDNLTIDNLWTFDKVIKFHRRILNIDENLKTKNSFRISLSFKKEHDNLKELNDYVDSNLKLNKNIPKMTPMKFYDFIKENIKEYNIPFTFRFNNDVHGGIHLHPGADRRAFLTALSDDTKIKLIICDRRKYWENQVLNSFSDKAISLFDKTPEEISKILKIESNYNTKPNAQMMVAYCKTGQEKGLIEVSQAFESLTRETSYIVEYTKNLIIVNSIKIAYLKEGKWLPSKIM